MENEYTEISQEDILKNDIALLERKQAVIDSTIKRIEEFEQFLKDRGIYEETNS